MRNSHIVLVMLINFYVVGDSVHGFYLPFGYSIVQMPADLLPKMDDASTTRAAECSLHLVSSKEICGSNQYFSYETCRCLPLTNIPKILTRYNDNHNKTDNKVINRHTKEILLHVGIISGILLMLLLLGAAYICLHRRNKLDVLSSMARHRGMSMAHDSIITADELNETRDATEDFEKATEEELGNVTNPKDTCLSNPSYEEGEFTTVDLEVDMFDDGHSIPDYTLRRSSIITKPVLKIQLSNN